ncbi:MAG TPA: hypothetical protein VHO03_20875 [Ignavibacteriales bacterium]|nr:hypothetical protein [Ignavibacteriales bacterium]
MFKLKTANYVFIAFLILFAACKNTANAPEDSTIEPKDTSSAPGDTTKAPVDTTKGPINPGDDYLPLSAGNFWEYNLHSVFIMGGSSTIRDGKITLRILSGNQNEYKVETTNEVRVIDITYITDTNIKRDTSYQNLTKTGTIRIDSNRVYFDISTQSFGGLQEFSHNFQINRFYPAGSADTVSISGTWNFYNSATYSAVKNKGMVQLIEAGGRGTILHNSEMKLINYSVK